MALPGASRLFIPEILSDVHARKSPCWRALFATLEARVRLIGREMRLWDFLR